MAISFPVTIPSVGGIAEPLRWTMVDTVGVGESPYTLSQEVFEHSGKRWGVEVTLIRMQRANAEEWIAFLASLRGRRGTFYFGDPVGATGRGTLTGTPLIKGASQTGQTILMDGATAGVTNWIRKGDWIQIGTGLHKSLTDANSDGSGNVTLELWPGPRSAPADNDPITVSNAKGIFRLTSNERSWDLMTAMEYGMSFAAMEAF